MIEYANCAVSGDLSPLVEESQSDEDACSSKSDHSATGSLRLVRKQPSDVLKVPLSRTRLTGPLSDQNYENGLACQVLMAGKSIYKVL